MLTQISPYCITRSQGKSYCVLLVKINICIRAKMVLLHSLYIRSNVASGYKTQGWAIFMEFIRVVQSSNIVIRSCQDTNCETKYASQYVFSSYIILYYNPTTNQMMPLNSRYMYCDTYCIATPVSPYCIIAEHIVPNLLFILSAACKTAVYPVC